MYFSENVQYVNLNAQNLNFEVELENKKKIVDDLAEIVGKIPLVRGVAYYRMASGETLIGVLPEPLFSLSDRLNLIQNIEKIVSDITQKKAYVSLDTDMFVSINKCKDDEKAQSIKEQIIIRNRARM